MQTIDEMYIIPPLEGVNHALIRIECEFKPEQENEVLSFYSANRRYLELYIGDNFRNLPLTYEAKVDNSTVMFRFSLIK